MPFPLNKEMVDMRPRFSYIPLSVQESFSTGAAVRLVPFDAGHS